MNGEITEIYLHGQSFNCVGETIIQCPVESVLQSSQRLTAISGTMRIDSINKAVLNRLLEDAALTQKVAERLRYVIGWQPRPN